MSDYIDRQAAIDVLEERLRANGYSNVGLVSELNRSIGYLMQLPSAEVEPVKHGRWEMAGREDPCIYYCSECHHMTDMEWPYCAECGARMEASE